MSHSSAPSPEVPAPEPANLPAGWKVVRQGENLIVVAALAAMTLLPVVEVALRQFFKTGVPASATMVQHLVLAVGMLGGALAARENRLLSLSVATHWLKDGWLTAARVFSNGFAAAISALLTAASWQFVMSQRSLGQEFAFGIPRWVVQSLIVVGFALVTVRLVWHAADRWRWRAVTLVLAAGFIAVALDAGIPPENLRWPAMIVLLLAVIFGAPIFTALGGIALIMLWSGGEPVGPIPLKHYQLTVNATLPSLPLFTLAGYFLAEGGAAKRLVRLFQAWFGSLRGGPAIVTTLVCAFFTSFTGASGATILALGGVLMPVLVSARYAERSSLGLLTGAGSLGMLFPPCLPPILYAIIASSGGEVSIGIKEIFLGGFLPGLLLVGLTVLWGLRIGKRAGDSARTPFVAREAWAATWAAKWELLVPVVALTSLFSGFATPVEAAALTAFYTFVVSVVIQRDLHLFRDVPRVMTECGLLIGGVLLILGVALGFTHYLIDAQIPDQAVAWATTTIHSKWIFLLVLNVVLLVIGGLVEIYAAIVVVVPLLVPIGAAFGIDPVHLGIIFLANMELGFLAPPVGINLLLASYRFNKPMSEVTRASLPMLAVMVIGVLLITYVPWLTTWLPGLFK
ncbi:MAG TPA: TRAP transporter large permease subunit [Verrucomicrobiae bacterium]|nr:TRAP transporter large permease subunit [Verrucomicrobiae bacterium]